MPRDHAANGSAIDDLIAEYQGLEGPLLPLLHAIQARFGHVPDWTVPVIAEALTLTKAEVHGVVTFYHDFRDHPAGKHVVKICRAEACQAMGGNALAEAVQARLGLDWHQTTPDGRVTLEPIFCLGLCACGPAAMVDGKLIGRADVSLCEAVK